VKRYYTSKVFVPGGMPKLTYVPRNAIKLETRLGTAVENLHKLIAVTGQTKSGKTVLVNTILPRAAGEHNIWLDGGHFAQEDDFWLTILQELDGATKYVPAKV
jgi:type II secretory pathway predicted ATPase ExeA